METIECIIKSIPMMLRDEMIMRVEHKFVDQIKLPSIFFQHILAPEIHEIWQFIGEVNQSDTWGIELLVKDGGRVLPSGDVFINYIGKTAKYRNIGLERAQRLWYSYKEDIYRALKEDPTQQIAEITNIEFKYVENLQMHFNKYQNEINTVEWLHKHQFPRYLALKITRIFEEDTPTKLMFNPYILVGLLDWKELDKICTENLSVKIYDERRLLAAIDFALSSAWQKGDTAISFIRLKKSLTKLLDIDGCTAEKIIVLGIENNTIIQIKNTSLYQSVGVAGLEQQITKHIQRMLKNLPRLSDTKFEVEKISLFEERTGLSLNSEQKIAIKFIYEQNFACIKGGAGTGKTTLLAAIYEQIEQVDLIFQAALSNKARIRMEEATQLKAFTLVKLLKLAYCKQIPDYAWIFIDEASMLDLAMMYRIIINIPQTSKLFLVGDTGQLPPIGPGLIFHRLTANKENTVELKEIHRTSVKTGIPQIASLIRNQAIPNINNHIDAYKSLEGISFVTVLSEDVRLKNLVLLYNFLSEVGEDIPQIISTTNDINTKINSVLHSQFIESAKYEGKVIKNLKINDSCFIAEGERVIWERVNDYERGIFNGSMGVLTRVYDEAQIEYLDDGKIFYYAATVNFDSVGDVNLSNVDLQNLKLAYSITCHKSQGSQWNRVIVNLTNSYHVDNSWLYTAVTRAAKQVVIVGNEMLFNRICISKPIALKRTVGFQPCFR